MNAPPDAARFAQVARRLDPGAALLRAWPLTGGVSAEVAALELLHADGRARTVIVRQHGAADRRANPRIAAAEFHLLRALHAAGLPVPEPLLVDESGAIFALPYLVLEYVAGEPDFAPADLAACLDQSAAALAAIHRCDLVRVAGVSLPNRDAATAARIATRPARLDELDRGRAHPGGAGGCLDAAAQCAGPAAWRFLAGESDLAGGQTGRHPRLGGRGRRRSAGRPGQQPPGNVVGLRAGRHAPLHGTLSGPDAGPGVCLAPHLGPGAALRPAFKLAEWAGDPIREGLMRTRLAWFVDQALAGLPTG